MREPFPDLVGHAAGVDADAVQLVLLVEQLVLLIEQLVVLLQQHLVELEPVPATAQPVRAVRYAVAAADAEHAVHGRLAQPDPDTEPQHQPE